MTGLNTGPTADARVARHWCLTLALTPHTGPTGTPEVARGFRPHVEPPHLLFTAAIPPDRARVPLQIRRVRACTLSPPPACARAVTSAGSSGSATRAVSGSSANPGAVEGPFRRVPLQRAPQSRARASTMAMEPPQPLRERLGASLRRRPSGRRDRRAQPATGHAVERAYGSSGPGMR